MNRNKGEILEVILGVIGLIYIGITIIGIVFTVGTTPEPSEFTLASGLQVLIAFMAWHWAIEWIKDMYK